MKTIILTLAAVVSILTTAAACGKDSNNTTDEGQSAAVHEEASDSVFVKNSNLHKENAVLGKTPPPKATDDEGKDKKDGKSGTKWSSGKAGAMRYGVVLIMCIILLLCLLTKISWDDWFLWGVSIAGTLVSVAFAGIQSMLANTPWWFPSSTISKPLEWLQGGLQFIAPTEISFWVTWDVFVIAWMILARNETRWIRRRPQIFWPAYVISSALLVFLS